MTLIAKLGKILHQKDGPLTRDLLRSPAEFGLGQLPDRLKPDAVSKSICGFCSTGCALNIHLKDGEAISLSPATDYVVNSGLACPKGWEALAPLKSSDRATSPLLGNKGEDFKEIEWDEALKTFCKEFKSIQKKHGKDSVAFLSTGQITMEEMATLGVLTKFGMGLVHGDGNTRQCMATAATAYKESFGFDAPPYTYKDFEESDTIILIGSNMCISHPIMWERISRNKNNPEIIVIDPRRTETAQAATKHYALKPDSDLSLFYGLANLLIKENAIDENYIKERCSDFEDFKSFVQVFDLEFTSSATGLAKEKIEELVSLIRNGKAVSFWWTMGVNQSHQGTRTAQAIINLALMTGNIGSAGTGANSITGQCNAMGSRLYSNTTNLLGGYDFKNAEHRKKVASILDIDENLIPTQNSWKYHEIVKGISEGKIKGLYIIGTNPSHSWINHLSFKELLKKLDFLVVQDMYNSTETVMQADLVLPAAGWGEKEGVFINSERRLGLIKKVAKAPGKALSDFHIFKLIAHYWGCSEVLEKWEKPEDVFQTLKTISAGQPSDITGIDDYQHLETAGGIQWPYTGNNENKERRLFEDGNFYHPDKKARFVFETPKKHPDKLSRRYAFTLLTGRGSSAQWHTETRTGKSEALKKLHTAGLYLEISTDDAKALFLQTHDNIWIESPRGKVKAKALVSAGMLAGQVFLPMHSSLSNSLTFSAFDPYSGQPAYKTCAVNVRPLPYWEE